MNPPLVCPTPRHSEGDRDCPLYAQRLDYGADEPLRRAILTEKRRPDLAALVRAEAARPQPPAPAPSPTHPTLPPGPEPLPIFTHLKQKAARP